MGREAEDQQSDEKRPQSRQRRHNHSWCHERCPFLRINPAANVVKLIAMDEEPNATSMVVPATNRSSSGNTAHRTLNSKTRCTVDVKRLACSTSPGASCLSPAQVESAAKMYAARAIHERRSRYFPAWRPAASLAGIPSTGCSRSRSPKAISGTSCSTTSIGTTGRSTSTRTSPRATRLRALSGTPLTRTCSRSSRAAGSSFSTTAGTTSRFRRSTA